MIGRLLFLFVLGSGVAACANSKPDPADVFRACSLDPIEWEAIAAPENAGELLTATGSLARQQAPSSKSKLFWFRNGPDRLLVCRLEHAGPLLGCGMQSWSFSKRENAWTLDELQRMAVCG